MGGSRVASSLSDLLRFFVPSAGPFHALVRPSREEFLKINIRVRGGERRGYKAKKKRKYSIFRSPRLFSFFSLLPRCVYHSFSFRFSFFSLSSRKANRAHSVSLFLSFSHNPTSRTVGRRRRERREEETDRFQGRGLGSEEIARGGLCRSAGEFIFSEMRYALGIVSLLPSFVASRINSFRRARSFALSHARGESFASPAFPSHPLARRLTRCTCGHADGN